MLSILIQEIEQLQDVGFNGLNRCSRKQLNYPSHSLLLPIQQLIIFTYYLKYIREIFLIVIKIIMEHEGNSPIDVTDTNRGSTTVFQMLKISTETTP